MDSSNLKKIFFLVIGVLILIIILKEWKVSMESFSTWDSYNTKEIKGTKWKYPNPTTRIEYDFKEIDPFTKEEKKISPLTWNSYVNHDLRTKDVSKKN
jgi:hypothetical protein